MTLCECCCLDESKITIDDKQVCNACFIWINREKFKKDKLQ
jgi:hypothetical protein